MIPDHHILLQMNSVGINCNGCKIEYKMIVTNVTLLVAMLNFGSLILLSFLSLSNPLRVNRMANSWFGVFLLFWASFWSDEMALLVTGQRLELQWLFLLRFIQYFTPLLFYFSVMFYSKPGYRIT